MNIVKWFEDLTNGHLLAWKTALATLVMALAGCQVALATQFWGVGPQRLAAAKAGRLHRWNGRTLIVLSLVLAFVCLWTQAGPTSPVRILLHSIFGSTLLALLAAKVTVVRLSAKGHDRLPWIGMALFVNYVAIWITSVLDFSTVSTNSPGPSGVLQAWVLVTGVIAAALGGLGTVAFLRRSAAPAG